MSISSPPGATPVRAMLTRRRPSSAPPLAMAAPWSMASAPNDPASTQPVTPSEQAERRPFLGAGGVGVDVDQARRHDLAARIDGLGRVRRDVGLDRRDAAGGDRHVAHSVDAERGVDDAPALDDQVIGRRKGVRNTGEHRGASGGRAQKIAPGQHDRSPPRLHPRSGELEDSLRGAHGSGNCLAQPHGRARAVGSARIVVIGRWSVNARAPTARPRCRARRNADYVTIRSTYGPARRSPKGASDKFRKNKGRTTGQRVSV